MIDKAGAVLSIVNAADIADPALPAASVIETRNFAVETSTVGTAYEASVYTDAEFDPLVAGTVPTDDHVEPLKSSTVNETPVPT